MAGGDSHIVSGGSWFPICGADPNGNVTLRVDQVANPDVMDAVEICEACVAAARQRGAFRREDSPKR